MVETIANKDKDIEKEDKIIHNVLKSEASKKGIQSAGIAGVFRGAYHGNIKTKQGGEENVINSHSGYDMAHELGHYHYRNEKDAGKVGKAAHKLYIGSAPHAYLTLTSGITDGIVSGIRKANKEEKGKKESKLSKLSPALTSLLVSSPMLTSEAAASIHGLKELKKQGASQKYLDYAKKDLAKAWGSYAKIPILSTLGGYGAKAAAYGITKGIKKLKKKRKEKKENKE